MQPYRENRKGYVIDRIFDSNVNEAELIWHRDKEDRIVLPLNENNWYLQMDNELPVKLNINEEYYIPNNVYHRVIKGTDELRVQIIETTFDEDEYEVYEVLEEGKKKKKKKKKDACYYKVKSRYDVWPSAYGSGALVKCRKVGAKNWGNSTDESIDEAKKKKGKTDYSKEKEKGLHGWFERKGGGGEQGWVDCNTCRKDAETGRKKCKPCGRKEGEERAKYPSCRPTPSSCSTPGKGKKWGKTDENVLFNEKNNIFVENNKNMIIKRLHELDLSATLGTTSMPDSPVKEPMVLPETKPSPRRKRIWEVKPAAKPKPKM